jgi:hypothetical protein
MEIGVLSASRETLLLVGFVVAGIGLVFGAIFLVGSFDTRSDSWKISNARIGLFISIFGIAAVAVLLGLAAFKYEAGNCLSSLPNKTFFVKMASSYGEDSVYIVAEGKASESSIDLTSRCAIIKQGGDKEVVGFPGGFVGPYKYFLEIKKHDTVVRNEHAGEIKEVKRTWQTYTFVSNP